ncbi:unnamed protein product, partial [Protopolystoma xenopodis]
MLAQRSKRTPTITDKSVDTRRRDKTDIVQVIQRTRSTTFPTSPSRGGPSPTGLELGSCACARSGSLASTAEWPERADA